MYSRYPRYAAPNQFVSTKHLNLHSHYVQNYINLQNQLLSPNQQIFGKTLKNLRNYHHMNTSFTCSESRQNLQKSRSKQSNLPKHKKFSTPIVGQDTIKKDKQNYPNTRSKTLDSSTLKTCESKVSVYPVEPEFESSDYKSLNSIILPVTDPDPSANTSVKTLSQSSVPANYQQKLLRDTEKLAAELRNSQQIKTYRSLHTQTNRSFNNKFIANHSKNKFRYRSRNRNRSINQISSETISTFTKMNVSHNRELVHPIIPILSSGSFWKQQFGLCSSTGYVHDISVSINNQNTLSGTTYDQLEILCNDEQKTLPISRDDFIRMWKTIILKRVQDVFQEEKKRVIDNRIFFSCSLQVPLTLYDLLISLGCFESKVNGTIYHIVLPKVKDAAEEKWWTLDDEITKNWIMTMAMMQHRFQMGVFPNSDSIMGSTLMLTTISDLANGQRTIKMVTNEVHQSQSFVRLVNDDIFEPDTRVTFDNCHLYAFNTKHQNSAMLQYVGDYVKSKHEAPPTPRITVNLSNTHRTNIFGGDTSCKKQQESVPQVNVENKTVMDQPNFNVYRNFQ